jgi:Asp-tRNA(Asn)/Glu-tRNA(Gln) amidotransferase A subunit family amidase
MLIIRIMSRENGDGPIFVFRRKEMRRFSKSKGSSGLGLLLVLGAAAMLVIGGAFALYFVKGKKINIEDIAAAEKISGLRFTHKERKLMLNDLRDNAAAYAKLRQVNIANSVPPSIRFDPTVPRTDLLSPSPSTLSHQGRGDHREQTPPGFSAPSPDGGPLKMEPTPYSVERPANLEDLAFAPVTTLARLIRSGEVTSTELTQMYLARLKKYGPRLECVITLTEELALAQAERADEEIAAGRYRGPLHGIPYGAKDLLATKGIRTTWGSKPYVDQVPDHDATVIERLEQAGAVLVAKLTLGELAWGDVWYGGKTRNPWNYEQGSSGSSAGSASATSAGLVGFAIGTETWGSIVSPSTRCGVAGLRPTYGRVSRSGAMALSWSMDKIGPICRSVEDCALVFEAIYGPDGKELSVVDLPFNWDPAADLNTIRVGYLKKAFEEDSKTKKYDQAVLEVLRSAGLEFVPFELPANLPIQPLAIILSAEAAAAFDGLTRSNRDDLMARQERNAWPNAFRLARFIPAVEYIQANRVRTLWMEEMAERMKAVDVYVAPSSDDDNGLLTNLTGHPAVVVPNGFDEKGSPTSISFIGGLYEEAKTLRVALAYEQATDFHTKHPVLKE